VVILYNGSMLESEKYALETMLYHIVFCPSFREVRCHEEPSICTFDTSITFQCSCGFMTRHYVDEVIRKYGVNNTNVYELSESEFFDRNLFNMIRCGSAKVCNKCFVNLINDYYRKNKDALKERRILEEMEGFMRTEAGNQLKRIIEKHGKKMSHAILSMEI